MRSRKQLAEVIDIIVDTKEADIEPSTIDEYKQLNKKCDTVIEKIKTRKRKKQRWAAKLSDSCSHVQPLPCPEGIPSPYAGRHGMSGSLIVYRISGVPALGKQFTSTSPLPSNPLLL